MEVGNAAYQRGGFPTLVTVHLTDDTRLAHLVETPTGGPGRELSNSDVLDRFTNLVDGLMPDGRARRLSDLVLSLGEQDSLEPLLHILGEPVENALG